MSDTKRSGGATYTAAGADYFAKRSLKRTAGVWGLWGLGIAAVISGDFSGWNFGIGSAGFGGMIIAFVIVTIMYFGMLFSIGEMAAAQPHTGGAYSFARSAMGPFGGFITGLAETIEYVATTAVIVYFSASYLDGVTSGLLGFSLADQGLAWIWWIVLYVIFIGLNSAGAAVSFRFALIISFISLAILAVFVIMAFGFGAVDFSSLWNIEPTEGNSTFLPFGLAPILTALPFAMWFYLGIEELPLAAEEAHNPSKDIPKAGIVGLITLVISGAIVLFVNTAVTGAESMGASVEPLLDGFRAFLPPEVAALLAAFALLGLLASLQGIMFAYGRNMYSLSRAGYYPKALSLTGKRQTPYVALIVGAVIGFVALVVVDATGGAAAPAGAIVLNIAIWGAVLSYLLQMVSYVVLRRRFPNASRPYKSPLGIAGAVVAGIIAAATFIGFLLIPTFLPAIIAIAVVYVVGVVLFALIGRHGLVLSPEEEYAISGGKHGDPQKEGYDAMEAEVFGKDAKTPKKK
jgi:ethanolamine permease